MLLNFTGDYTRKIHNLFLSPCNYIVVLGKGKPMKGSCSFTRREADQIKIILNKKCKAPSEEQKSFRDDLRAIGFYISDFTDSKKGFTSADFDLLVERQQVSIAD